MEKRYLRTNTILVISYEDIVEYYDALKEGTNNLPKTVVMGKLNRNIGDNIRLDSGGESFIIFNFYKITSDDSLVLSKLGISALTASEVNSLTLIK